MQYLGGKARIAKQLCAFLNAQKGDRFFVEPFCGGLNVTEHLEGERIALDANPALICLYKALQQGWEPPENVSEAMYAEVKAKQDMSDPLTAFVGFGCSFGGKWFGGYAFDYRRGGVNFAAVAKRALLRQIARCSDVIFDCSSYTALAPGKEHIVYADPPYANTTGYTQVGGFNHPQFWETIRRWARGGALCFVSEYSAPEDFIVVWEKEKTLGLRTSNGGNEKKVEKLFQYAGQA